MEMYADPVRGALKAVGAGRTRRCRRRTWRSFSPAIPLLRGRGTSDGVLSLTDEDVVVTQSAELPGAVPASVRPPGRPRGVWFWPERVGDDTSAIDVLRAEDLGDRVLVDDDQRGRGKGSGVEVEMPFSFVFTPPRRKDHRVQDLYARERGPQSRGAGGVGDVPGEPGSRRARSLRPGERRDYLWTDWADPAIEFVVVEVRPLGRWAGLAGMWQGWREVLAPLAKTAAPRRSSIASLTLNGCSLWCSSAVAARPADWTFRR